MITVPINNGGDDVSLLSFQKVKDERDYDRTNYARKFSDEEGSNHRRLDLIVRMSQLHPNRNDIRNGDRSGGGGGTYDDNNDGFDDDDEYDWQPSRSRRSRGTYHETSSISYIDYNDSYTYNCTDDGNNDSKKQRNSGQSSISHSSPPTGAIGSTIRTYIRSDSTATSAITFDASAMYYNCSQSTSQQYHQQRKQQSFVGFDGQRDEYENYRSDDESYSFVIKPQVINVLSPETNQQPQQLKYQYMHKTSLQSQHDTYSGREEKNPTSSPLSEVNEMVRYKEIPSATTRRLASSAGSSSPRRSRNNSTHRKGFGDASKSTTNTKSTKSTRNSKSKKGKRNNERSVASGRRRRSLNGLDDNERHRQRGDLTRGKETRSLDGKSNIGQRSTKSSNAEERRQRRRRREMMTGRATKHLLEEDDDKRGLSSSYYSRSSVLHHDVDEDGYCRQHPQIELMRLRSDGFWTTVRKKCPVCIQNEKQESNNRSTAEEEEEEELNRLKRRLAARAYHFSGNTWCEDWMQYFNNTHTIFGLCFHHPLHPLKLKERLVMLFGSIAIGLTISNMTYWYFIDNDYGADDVMFTLNSRHSKYTGIPEIPITKVMITLWTFGSFLHTVFDLLLWHLKACTICRYGGLVDEKLARTGRVVGLFIVMVVMGVGGYAVLLRSTIKGSFRFLLGYLVEFVLALFVYFPIMVTVLLSVRRPREMKREQRYLQRKRESKILRALESDDSAVANYGRIGSFDYFDEDQIL